MKYELTPGAFSPSSKRDHPSRNSKRRRRRRPTCRPCENALNNRRTSEPRSQAHYRKSLSCASPCVSRAFVPPLLPLALPDTDQAISFLRRSYCYKPGESIFTRYVNCQVDACQPAASPPIRRLLIRGERAKRVTRHIRGVSRLTSLIHFCCPQPDE